MTATMTALTWLAPHRQEVREVPVPLPAAGEVLVRVARVGICGSDVTAHKGVMGTARPGAIRGHEFAGTVVGGAPGAAEGARVTVNPVRTCGACPACRAGRESACPELRIIGVHLPGGYAELVAVPADAARAIPDGLSWEAAATAEPLAQARHDVVLASAGRELGRCLVIGVGSIGGLVAQALALSGAAEIVVADPDADRRAQASAAIAGLAAGAAVATIPTTADEPEYGFDTVFDVVGVEAVRREAVRLVRGGGTVLAIGLGQDEGALGWFDVTRREVTIRGANCYTPDDFAVSVDWLARGVVTAPDPHRVLPLAAAPETFEALAAGTDPFRGKTFLAP
jgi:threonine dehydrogenase-like Zn-dependent dehydrogenase